MTFSCNGIDFSRGGVVTCGYISYGVLIMKYINYIIFTILIFTLSSCATTYQKEGFTGGFSEVQLSKNRFKVSFKGNGFTGREKAINYTLLRSAELCLENSYKYFVIIDENNYEKIVTINTPMTVNTTGTASTYGGSYSSRTTFSGGGSDIYTKPRSTNIIDCYNTKPDGIYSYEASFIVDSIEK